jgi:AcrR family transcriptional regulator
MLRPSANDRLDQIVAAATRVFTRAGYRRAQMAEIAREMGVAPGTLYLYVEGKEALFALAIERAWGDRTPMDPDTLPLPTPPRDAIVARVRERLKKALAMPALTAALAREAPEDARPEFRKLVGELYDAIHRSRKARDLLGASALDWPELNALYYHEARREILERLTEYLSRRAREGRLLPLSHPPTAARLILETTAWFARHRYGDVDAGPVTDETARETVLHVLMRGFCGPDPEEGDRR